MPDENENLTPGNGETESQQNGGGTVDIGQSLTELCQELKNWFDRDRHIGTFRITEGVLVASFLVPGQYYRIIGSLFDDGVHKYGDTEDELIDETFDGAVWALAIPKPVINLATEIAEWRAINEKPNSAAMSPFMSESFGGYSYTKGSAFSNAGSGGMVSWKSAFAGRLNAWRKL